MQPITVEIKYGTKIVYKQQYDLEAFSITYVMSDVEKALKDCPNINLLCIKFINDIDNTCLIVFNDVLIRPNGIKAFYGKNTQLILKYKFEMELGEVLEKAYNYNPAKAGMIEYKFFIVYDDHQLADREDYTCFDMPELFEDMKILLDNLKPKIVNLDKLEIYVVSYDTWNKERNVLEYALGELNINKEYSKDLPGLDFSQVEKLFMKTMQSCFGNGFTIRTSPKDTPKVELKIDQEISDEVDRLWAQMFGEE